MVPDPLAPPPPQTSVAPAAPPEAPVTILVALHTDGSDLWQTTTGRRVGKNLYELLPTPGYQPSDDWEFPPGTIVECTPSSHRDGTPFLVAVRAVTPS